MARRKKAPLEVHREAISSAAENLFSEKGLEAATMDDIAREAGYSKATLYVYFKNKEAIISYLALKSMNKLYGYIESAIKAGGCMKEKYNSICRGLAAFYDEYPLYFETALKEINIDFTHPESDDGQSFITGEKINSLLILYLEDGINKGEFRKDLPLKPTLFAFWGMVSGFIQLASSKEKYIKGEIKLTKEQFLAYGFDLLYGSISNKG